MIGRRFAVTIGWMAGIASTTLGATLSPDIRTTTNSAAVRPAIQTFIDKEVTLLSSSTPSAQSAGREALVAEVQPGAPTQPQPSAPFLDAYADVLNSALKPLVNNPDPRVRLNAAIAAEKVAEKAGNARLSPVVTDLLNDQSQAVELWAIKACKYLLPSILANGVAANNDPLLKTFVKAVEQHSKSGPIMQTAYESLRFDPQLVPPAAWNQVTSAAVSMIQPLLENRLAQYQTGVPTLPSADAIGTSLIVEGSIWQAQNKDQQLRTVQDVADLMSAVAQRWDNATPSQRLDFAEIIKQVGAGLWVVGQNASAPDVQHAQEQLKVSSSTSAAAVIAYVDGIRAALKNVPAFAALKAAPSLEPLATTAPATTEPTTP